MSDVTRTLLGSDPRFTRYLLRMPGAFARADEAPDAAFYARERMVSHLDTTALGMVQRLVASLVTEPGPVVLDLMASWDSHLPDSFAPAGVTGLGMNAAELAANPALTRRIVHDLNADPALPFPDDTFDLVLNAVSVEYLTRPVEVFREVGRVLKPGGLYLVVFSNRFFPPKVVQVWQEASEHERVELVEAFFREAGAFDDPYLFLTMGLPRPVEDRYYDSGLPSDPIFAVFAEKEGGLPGRPPRIPPEDPARMEVDREAVEDRKRHVGETLTCPYCQERLSRWEVPDDPCIDWPNDFLYLCFNDACPFVVRGWRFMWKQGLEGHSYRFLLNPLTGGSTTVPIRGLHDLKPGIVATGSGSG